MPANVTGAFHVLAHFNLDYQAWQRTSCRDGAQAPGEGSREARKENFTYLVHVPDMSQDSIPTPSPLQVASFEIYQDKTAFLAHLNGPIFNGFVNRHKNLFLCTTVSGKSGEKITRPYVSAEFLKRIAGFVRP
jgi:quinol monooxygenase YgiN